MWYEWNTKEEFDLWHNALCEQLNYPLINTNQATGLPDETAQKTIAYTQFFEVNNKFIAWVDSEYSEGLVETHLRLPVLDIRETMAQ